MNLRELIATVADVTGHEPGTVKDCVLTACDVVADALADHERVKLPGLGRFRVRKGLPTVMKLMPQREPRAIVPHTVRFRAVKRLRMELNIRANWK